MAASGPARCAGREQEGATTNMAVRMTGGQAVVRALAEHGVDVAFGIPGVHTLAIYDALIDSSIRHVLGRHEQGVGFMADGYARASGKPGVALVITGPGVTNVATAIGGPIPTRRRCSSWLQPRISAGSAR